MLVIECNECGEPQQAANKEELVGVLGAHLASEHGQEPDEAELAGLIESEAYEAMDS